MKQILKKYHLMIISLLLTGFSVFKHLESSNYQQQLQTTQTILTQLSQEHGQLETQFQNLKNDFDTYKKENDTYITLGKDAEKIEKEQKALAQQLSKEQEDIKTATKKLEEEKANLQKEKEALQQERNTLLAEKEQLQQAQAASTPVQSGFVTAAPAQASAYYPNCSAARAAGAAPVRLGDPGYGRHLDRDGDGIGCE